jgi:hypothetical protein
VPGDLITFANVRGAPPICVDATERISVARQSTEYAIPGHAHKGHLASVRPVHPLGSTTDVSARRDETVAAAKPLRMPHRWRRAIQRPQFQGRCRERPRGSDFSTYRAANGAQLQEIEP